MFLEVEHQLELRYDDYISESFMEVRLEPKSSEHQTIFSFLLAVGPPTKVFRYMDWNENVVHHFSIASFHDEIRIFSRSLIDTHPAVTSIDAIDDPTPLRALDFTAHDFLEFHGPVMYTPLLERLNRSVKIPAKAPLGEQVQRLGSAIHRRFRYKTAVTRFDSTTDDFLRARAGVCQDFAHLLLGLLRLRGIPSRYVSGYLHVNRSRRRNQSPAQSHAWIEFYSPRNGWVAFDPTHNHGIDERYIVVGYGRHYNDVPPNKGIYKGGAAERMHVEVRTRPSTPKNVSMLHDEIREIEVPVFREVPERRIERALAPSEDPVAQQQQQQ